MSANPALAFTDAALLTALMDRHGHGPAPVRTARRPGEFVDVLIPVGPDHTATLIIEKDALDILRGGNG